MQRAHSLLPAARGERKWTVSHVLFWPPRSCEMLQPPRTQSVLHLRAARGLKCHRETRARLAVGSCFSSALGPAPPRFNPSSLPDRRVKSLPCLLGMFRACLASAAHLTPNAFLFDTMCEVINPIATATGYTDSRRLQEAPPDLRGFMAGREVT